MSVEYTILCDGCGMLGDAAGESAQAARKALRTERGWRVNVPGGKDYCADCRPSKRKGRVA